MARLLGFRILDPEHHLYACQSSPNLAVVVRDGTPCFSNPAFEEDIEAAGDDWSSPLSIQRHEDFTSTNNNTIQPDQNGTELSSDSGVLICSPGQSPDSSSADRTSPDSGVHDVVLQNGYYDDKPVKEWPTASPEFADTAKGKFEEPKKETLLAVCVQIIIPFLIAGAGTCGAGIVLDYVEGWEVFKKTTELYILVPTLLGLKGNLEMTLASRVSTQANLGKLETLREKWQMSWGNMALIQCQATVMGLLAASFATVMSIASNGFDIKNALLLCASSLFTAFTASLVLGTITLIVVIVSHKCNINPDNVATPIAASLGDVTTLGILAAISNYLFRIRENVYAPSLVIGIFILCIPIWVYLSYINPYVKQVLYFGWVPIITALIITSAGGSVLEFSVSQFTGFTIFQPVINGVAGNLVAVQASRISTYFHRHSEKPGSRPPDGSALCISPLDAYFGKCAHARTARILLALVIPGHILFGYAITLLKGGDTVLTPTFLPIYLVAAFLQVSLLLYIAQCLVQILWKLKIDPDNSAIPLLTALGDLSGTMCLTAAFYIHRAV